MIKRKLTRLLTASIVAELVLILVGQVFAADSTINITTDACCKNSPDIL